MHHVTKSRLREYKNFLLTQGELFEPAHPDGEKKYIDVNIERYGLHLSIIEELINTKKNVVLDVLDIGCWPGHLAMILRKYYQTAVCGVGLTTNDLFRSRLGKYGIPFTPANIEKEALGYSNNSFDLVLFTEVIEHLFNPFLVGKEISRVLKKNGIMILSTPNQASLRNRIHFVQGKMTNPEFFMLADQVGTEKSGGFVYPIHVRLWTPAELKLFMTKIGLSVVCEYYQDFPDADAATIKERILRVLVRLFPARFRDMVTIVAAKR